jgi:pimeloyl-ACP methyl ester carboxylesterase
VAIAPSVDSSELTARGGRFVRANGINIHYVEAGQGPPLVLLHGGAVSTGAIWSGTPIAYQTYLEEFAQHFRVIAPDTRGAGLTQHDEGTASYALLADDVVALIEALQLEAPLLAGFSEGGATATVVGIRWPGAVRAIVCDAGYDCFNPQAASFAMMRQMLGGSPDATRPDPDAAQRLFASTEETRHLLDLIKADHDDAQGPGYWRTYLSLAFERTTRSPGYTFDDLAAITVPTLVLVGDRDEFCSVAEGLTSFRALPRGELAVIPNHGHLIGEPGARTTAEFLRRHAGG